MKLGYGGTKSEMERLLADAQAISGIQYDISSYADVVDAIHVIQTEMGITGTTAKEASSTIQGSIASMGSAWTNLITGLADPTQNLDQLINNFVDSVITVGDNLIPRISMILESITKLILSLAPKLVAEIPNIVSQLLPSVIQGAVSIINAIVQTLPQLIDTIVGMLPQFLSGIQQIFTGIIEALPSLMQTLVSQLPTLIPMIIDGAVEMFVMLANSYGDIIQPIIDNLPAIILSITNALLENLPALIEGCVNLIVALAGAMPQITMSLIQCIPQIITNIVNALFSAMPILLQGIGTIFGNAWNTIVNIFSGAGKFFGNLFSEAVNIIQSVFGKIVGFFSGVWSKITGIFKRIGEVVGKAITNVVSKAVNGVLSTACRIINGFISAINFAIGIINAIPGVNISKLNKLSVPQLERGGVLKRGQVGLLEGNGTEAVVPLEKNTGWLTRIADMLDERMSGRGALITPPTLENVRAGNRAENTTNGQSKIDELIELIKMLVDRDTDITVPIYIGNELIDEYILNKNSRTVLRSGGRA